eukprot:Em0244g1a
MKEETEVAAQTAVDWYNFICDICSQYFIDHPAIIGGPGVEVEIDESKFGRESITEAGRWKQHIRPGSIIYSDEWKAYSRITATTGRSHETVNQSLHFVDPATSAHTGCVSNVELLVLANAMGEHLDYVVDFNNFKLSESTDLPTNWELQRDEAVMRLAIVVKLYDIPPELVINYDQTAQHLVPTAKRCKTLVPTGFRRWMKDEMPWLIVLYIPAACTSKLQPCDIVLNKTVKDGAFIEDLIKNLQQVPDSKRPQFLRTYISTSNLKPKLPVYVLAGLASARSRPEKFRKAWMIAGWLRAWDPQFQRQAIQHAVRLFPSGDYTAINEPHGSEPDGLEVEGAAEGNQQDEMNFVAAANALQILLTTSGMPPPPQRKQLDATVGSKRLNLSKRNEGVRKSSLIQRMKKRKLQRMRKRKSLRKKKSQRMRKGISQRMQMRSFMKRKWKKQVKMLIA